MLTPARLAALIDGFAAARIAVVGDCFLDKYLDVDPALEETSVETGRPAHQIVNIRTSPGAAGTVMNNLASLEPAALHAIGIIGDDGEGYELRCGLEQLACNIEHLHVSPDRFTPTYCKPRNVDDPSLAGEHARLDTKNRTPTSADLEQQVLESVRAVADKVDAIIIADQINENDCGVMTTAVRDGLCAMAARHPRVIFWADSRRHIHQFRHVIIKPNQFEAVGEDDPRPGDSVSPTELERAVSTMREQTQAPICTTCGPGGMVVSDPAYMVVPGVAVDGEIDITGAGDSATAGAVMALAAGATLPEAALVGNLVASITIEQLATTGVAKPEQLLPRLDLWRRQQEDATHE